MKCPHCGYDGDQWMSDGVLRSDRTQGYFCSKCGRHFVVTPADYSADLEALIRRIVEEELHRHRQEDHE